MRRILALALAATLVLSTRADAWLIQGGSVDTGKQLLLTNAPSVLSNAADRTLPLGYTATASASSFKTVAFPVSGSIKSLKYTELTQPTGASTRTATILINGSPTSATCTVTSAIAICDWLGTVSVSAGDSAEILIHPSGSPPASIATVSVGFTPTTLNDTIIPAGANSTTFSTSTTNVIQPFSGASPAAIGNALRLGVLPDSGTIDRLFVKSVAPGTLASGKSYAYTMLVNGSASTLTTSVSETATSNSDVTHTVSVSAGDYLNFQAVPTSTPTASDAVFGIRYLPTSAGSYSYISAIGNSTPSSSAVRYINLSGGAFTAAEQGGITHSQTFEKIRAKSNGAVGLAASGKKYTVTLRVNGTDTALTCDIVEVSTTCSGTGSVVVNDNDLVDFSVTPTGTPTLTQIGASLLAKR